MLALAIGLLSAMVLELVYRTISSEWPNAYSSAKGLLERRARKGPVGFIFLRFAPTYSISLACSVTAERAHASPWIATAAMALIYLTMRDGRAFINTVAHSLRRRFALATLYAGNVMLVILAAALGLASRKVLQTAIPTPTEFIVALWTATLAAVLAVNVQRTLSSSFASQEDIVASHQESVGAELWQFAKGQAHATNCDPELIQSIIAIENGQRPRWLRRVEYRVSPLMKLGSYGIAQMTSERPLTDEESISALCESFESFYPEREEGRLMRRRLKTRLRSHNDDEWFCDQVIDLYSRLVPDYPLLASTAFDSAYDGRPVLEILTIDSAGPTCWMGGTIATRDVAEVEVVDPTRGDSIASFRDEGMFRGTWRRDVPDSTREIQVKIDGEPASDNRDISYHLL